MPRLFLMFLLSLPVLASCQDTPPPCAYLKTGIYYSYPRNTSTRYICVRDGDREKEIDMDTGDSSVWQIQWLDDCSYTMKYLSGNDELKPRDQQFLDKHIIALRIEKSTTDYYVYSAHADKISKRSYATDTFWLHEKSLVVSNQPFQFIRNELFLTKTHFSDTSRYAVIYLYRPGKLTNSWAVVPVYCNDTLLWIAHNRTGTLIKVTREGVLELTSKVFKDVSSVKVDVRFGQKYYIKSMIHWGFSSRGYNFILEMAAIKPEMGQPEFEQVRVE
jgi:hypothetical protein